MELHSRKIAVFYFVAAMLNGVERDFKGNHGKAGGEIELAFYSISNHLF